MDGGWREGYGEWAGGATSRVRRSGKRHRVCVEESGEDTGRELGKGIRARVERSVGGWELVGGGAARLGWILGLSTATIGNMSDENLTFESSATSEIPVQRVLSKWYF